MPATARSHSRALRATSGFRRSSNIERDGNDQRAIDSFILTGCARVTLRRILAGIKQDSQQRAWTLTGPFGTGKSSLCVFAATLFSPGGPALTRRARQSVEQHDTALASSIQQEFKPSQGLVPVLITGSRQPLHIAIARGFAQVLRSVCGSGAARIAGELESIINPAPANLLKVIDTAIQHLITEVHGAQGCLLVIDELGKLLEFAASHPDQSDVFLLQQIAELASRPHSGLAVLGVLHQDFSGYAKTLLPTQQQEWEKIRGRFEDIVFEQSALDMIRLIADAIERERDVGPTIVPQDQQAYRGLWRSVLNLGVIHSTNGQQQPETVLDKCYPLHPAVALLLGPIFKRFGQNERSAFSFLRSAEPFGLKDFTSRQNASRLYRLVDLHQYLIAALGDALLVSRDGRRWADAFNIEVLHPSLSDAESDVLRTVALLNIVGRWNGLSATAEAVVRSVEPLIGRTDAEGALLSLQQKSAIVFRKFNKSYSLWEGSDIDLEAKLAEARSDQAADTPTTHLLRGAYVPRPLVARRHSFERGTLRYFDIIPASAESPSEAADAIARSTADGHLLVLLHDLADPQTLPNETVRAMTEPRNVVLCVPAAAREVDTFARELAAIDSVERSVRELHNDQTALRELAARKDEVRRQLDQSLADLLTPGRFGASASRWIKSGVDLRIRSRRELNERLSAICDELFPDCPVIQNEIINRRELSSSAAAAQGELLKAMVERGELENLDIQGNPPEKSVYLSVLRKLGLHQRQDNRWMFSAGSRGLDSSARPMMRAIRQFLDASSAEAKPLNQLFDLLRAPPFGIRDGVIPIVVCAALLAHEADVAIYENGAFLPQLTGPALEKMVKAPSGFAVRRWHVNGVRVIVFEQLAEMLGQSAVAGRIEQRDLLDVVKPLIRFVRRLNEFCRNTKTFSPTALAVRQALLDASEPDELLFTDLPRACGLDPFLSRKPGKTEAVQQFRRALQNALAELQKGYDTLLHSLMEEVGSALECPSDPRGTRALLRNRASQVIAFALSPDLRVFIARLADPSADDRSWIESIAAFLANKHPSQWNDDDRPRLQVRLAQIGSGFRALEALVVARRDDARSTADESIHLAVAGTAFPESKLVVHVGPEESGAVASIELQLRSVLDSHRGPRRLFVAALARVVREALSDEPMDHAPERCPT